MSPEGELRDGEVVVGGDARQRLHDARGYGRPLPGGEVGLAPVEAAHLLLSGHLSAVDGMDLPALLATAGGGLARRLAVYADLRERGFYLSPARPPWLPDAAGPAPDADLVVYRTGTEPAAGEVAHRVRVVGERERVPAAALGTTALAVADDEWGVSYFETGRPEPAGTTDLPLPADLPATLLDDRVVLREYPPELHGRGFYGQALRVEDPNRDLPEYLQLSLTEAAYLADRGAVVVEDARADGSEGGPAEDSEGGRTDDTGGSDTGGGRADGPTGGPAAIREAGRALAGARFDRRLAAYAALRDAGVAPKTGFKFGADFRTYDEVGSVADLGHAEWLVHVVPAAHEFPPRSVALDVRMAEGVRKEMVYALVADDGSDVSWLRVGRLTP